MNNLLINRKYNVPGNWYAPKEFLNNKFKSVVKSNLYDTSSSAGDWGGWFIQKIGKVFYLIMFYQENNYSHSGFTLFTGNHPVTSWNDNDGEKTNDEIYSILLMEEDFIG